jgi:Flp pilus assembly protein CpaB
MNRVLLVAVSMLANLAVARERLVAVVVAAEDLPAGTVVTLERVSQRSLPEAWVTSSVVTPDSVSYIVSYRTKLPMLKGDPILWSYMATRKTDLGCERLLHGRSAQAQLAFQRQLIRSRRAR